MLSVELAIIIPSSTEAVIFGEKAIKSFDWEHFGYPVVG